MISAGLKLNTSLTASLICFVAHHAGAERVDAHRDRIGITDRVGELDFRARRQTRGDDVLGHVTAHVSRAAIHLGRVLAAERAAAVPAHAAVAVDDDLAAGQAGVALRPADDETAGRVDQILGFPVEHLGREHLLDDFLDDEIADRPCA